MSKTETMRQLNAAATAQRLKQSGRNPAAGSPDAQSGSPALDRLSTAVQELLAQLLSLQSQLASWSQVVSERMAAALRTARQQDAAQQTIEMQALRQERAASVQEMEAVLNRLTPLTASLERTQQFLRLDGQEPEWVGARRWVLWKGILLGVVAAAILGGGAAAALEQDVGGVAAGAGGSAALSIGVGGDDGRREGRDGGPSKAAEAADQVATAADLAGGAGTARWPRRRRWSARRSSSRPRRRGSSCRRRASGSRSGSASGRRANRNGSGSGTGTRGAELER